MRVVIQRVKNASVSVEGKQISSIEKGFLILVGIEDVDTKEDVEWLTQKIVNLRVFDDENGIMNKSVVDVDGEILVVSQFTLFASTKKGNRPSYIRASKPDFAVPMYQQFCEKLTQLFGKEIKTGIFCFVMQGPLLNDGPVTIVIDTRNKE